MMSNVSPSSSMKRSSPRSFLSKMWMANSAKTANDQGKATANEILFHDLFQEVKCAAPSAQLSYPLRSRLERCDSETKKEICNRKRDGCSPLFLACKKGNVEIVEYLLSTCSADVEQRGLYEVPDDRSVHNVTPLWCASVAGKVKVVEILVKYGADVDSVSDTGSTPVRSACFMTHVDIVKLLVKSKADIQKPNYNGGTCLINSVQSVELCEFLLQNGANVNAQDIQNKTALHYAIQEHRLETMKLLIQYGANPYLESRYKDDALQTACLKGATEIFTYLIDHVEYSAERVSSAFELLGSTFLDEHHDSQKTLQFWKAACDIREKYHLTKPANTKPTKLFASIGPEHKEFRGKTELELISLDLDALRMQSLLICERILGTVHKDMIYRLMYRGAAYADSLQYNKCISLWKYALELRVAKDSVLFCDTCFTAQALVKLFLDLFDKHNQGLISTMIRVEDIMDTIDILSRDLPKCMDLLAIAPQFKRQTDSFDKVLRIITHLLHLVTRLPAFKENEVSTQVKRKLHSILNEVNPCSSTGDSLLHLSVMRNNTLKSHSLFEEGQYSFFPSLEVSKLLLESGAKPNAVNKLKSTPLHTAATASNFKNQIVELLLSHGAHIDQRNSSFAKPSEMLQSIKECKIKPVKFIDLKCLAANIIVKHGIKYQGEVPVILEEFVQKH